MGCAREKRKSEKTLDTIFQMIRSLDLMTWTGQKWCAEEINENVQSIKVYLDRLVEQYEIEVGIRPPPPIVEKSKFDYSLLNQLQTPPPTENKYSMEPEKKSGLPGSLT